MTQGQPRKCSTAATALRVEAKSASCQAFAARKATQLNSGNELRLLFSFLPLGHGPALSRAGAAHLGTNVTEGVAGVAAEGCDGRNAHDDDQGQHDGVLDRRGAVLVLQEVGDPRHYRSEHGLLPAKPNDAARPRRLCTERTTAESRGTSTAWLDLPAAGLWSTN